MDTIQTAFERIEPANPRALALAVTRSIAKHACDTCGSAATTLSRSSARGSEFFCRTCADRQSTRHARALLDARRRSR
jgi:hypothetical protein